MEYHFSLATSIHHYSYNFNLGNHRLYKCFLNFDDYLLQLMKTFKSASQKVVSLKTNRKTGLLAEESLATEKYVHVQL